MSRHVNFSAIAPAGIAALRGLEAYVRGSGLDATLLGLSARAERPSSACTRFRRGARPPSSRHASVPRSSGRRR